MLGVVALDVVGNSRRLASLVQMSWAWLKARTLGIVYLLPYGVLSQGADWAQPSKLLAWVKLSSMMILSCISLECFISGSQNTKTHIPSVE